jgi:hypothetical protein
MDVITVLRNREKLWGTRIYVEGQMRGECKFNAEPKYELAWIVQNVDAKREFGESILVLRSGFLKAIINDVSIWIGGFGINERISISGILVPSPDDQFPAALTDITTFRLEDPKKGKEFDFSLEGEN